MNSKADLTKNQKRGSGLESLLHSEHTVTIEKMSVGGDGVARIPLEARTVVAFIPKSAPLDVVKIKISRAEKTFLYGEILEIIKPGPSRRTTPCPVASECGGCSWQHFDEAEQINQKEILLKELFAKFANHLSYNLLPTVVTEQNFSYRNRIQLKHLGTQLGYFKQGSHDIVSIDDCLIAEEPLRQKIKELSKTLKPAKELKKYELRINQNNQVEHYPIGEHGEGLAFSQVNNSVNQQLVATTTEIIKRTISQETSTSITELYAGAGNFTFKLAEQFSNLKIEAVELNSQLTRAATEQIKDKKLIKQVTFFTTKAEIFCNQRPLSKKLVLLDPPRSGCHPDVILRLAETAPEHIIYISCHPTMLVRDLALLTQKTPHYTIQHLQIFDMFPQTDHFETLCVLSLKI